MSEQRTVAQILADEGTFHRDPAGIDPAWRENVLSRYVYAPAFTIAPGRRRAPLYRRLSVLLPAVAGVLISALLLGGGEPLLAAWRDADPLVWVGLALAVGIGTMTARGCMPLCRRRTRR